MYGNIFTGFRNEGVHIYKGHYSTYNKRFVPDSWRMHKIKVSREEYEWQGILGWGIDKCKDTGAEKHTVWWRTVYKWLWLANGSLGPL